MADRLTVTENNDGTWKWSIERKEACTHGGTESSMRLALQVGSGYIESDTWIEIGRLPPKPKPTPGPWVAWEGKGYWWVGNSESVPCVARIRSGEANAKLISAAPDAIKVCQMVYEDLTTNSKSLSVSSYLKGAKATLLKAGMLDP